MKYLYKYYNYIFKIDGNEKGVAILLSLGLLTLIAILALTFATTTSINRKAAKSNNDLASARMLAKSVVNRAMLAMATYNGDLTNLQSVYSNNAGSSDRVGDEDLSMLLRTTINDIEYYTDTAYKQAAIKPTWQYITIDSGSGVPKIYGRMAFTVSEISSNSGWLMPYAVVDNSNTAASEYDGSLSSPPSNTGIGVSGRPGVNINEIWLGSLGILTDEQLIKAGSVNSSYNSTNGTMPITGWGDSGLFFNSLGISDAAKKKEILKYFSFGNPEDKEALWIDNNNDSIKADNELYHRFNLARTDWNTTLAVTDIIKAPVLFNTGTEDNSGGIPWLNNFKISSGMGSITAAKNQIAANLIDYNDIDDAATTDSEDNPTYVGLEKCPYINEVKIKFVATTQYYNGLAMAQIVPEDIYVEVVNMYNNTNTPTFNLIAKVKMDWQFDMAGGEPYKRSDVAYVPLTNTVKQSYMSNAHKFVDQSWYNTGWVSSTVAESNVTNLTIKSLTVKLYESGGSPFYDFANLEPYNNYPAVDTISGTLDINPANENSGHEFQMQTPGGYYDMGTMETYYSDPQKSETNFSYSGSASEIKIMVNGDGRELTINGITGNLSTSAYYEIKGDLNVNLRNTKLDSNNWGQAKGHWEIDISGTGITITPDPGFGDLGADAVNNYNFPSTVSLTQKTLFIDYAIDDPRQNLLATDWGGVTMFDNTDTGTIGVVNNKFTNRPAIGDIDTETATEPWNISTAYVRNGTMKSPWELGTIHRAKAWQTLNLKKYDTAQGMNGGGNNYSDGDANILDQIKMSSNTTTLGKVNLNVSEPKILSALFEGISTNSGFESPGSIVNTVTKDSADKLDEALRNSSTITKFKTRAEVVNSTSLFYDNNLDSLNQTNNAAQEEIIGKFINLTKADNIKTNQLTIIAVAQTIDDVGGGITISKDLDYNGSIGTADEISLGVDIDGNGVIGNNVSETISNVQFGKYDQYADSITGTQKLLIILYKTTQNKYRIRHLEYIND